MIIKKDKSALARFSLLLIGTIFFAVGLGFSLFYLNVLDNSTKVTGTILVADEDMTLVEYEVDGQYFEQYLNESSDTYYYGKQIKLYYSYNTKKAYSNISVYLFPSLFGGIGLITIIVFIIWSSTVYKRKQFLLNKDKYIKKTAKIIDIKRNKFYAVNDQHPFQLICEVYFEGEKLILKSSNFWDELYFEEHYVVDVYFKNKRKYVVDLSSYRRDEIYYEMEEFN